MPPWGAYALFKRNHNVIFLEVKVYEFKERQKRRTLGGGMLEKVLEGKK